MRTVPGPTDSVVVVGAGLGGLSAALHLAGAGRDVTVIERESVPGGRCGLIRDRGYRFDTGPTVLTMPELVARPLAAVGEKLDDWLSLHRLDPAYRARFADGTSIDVRADPDAMAAEIATTCGPRDAEGYRRFVRWLRELYRIELPHFIDRNLVDGAAARRAARPARRARRVPAARPEGGHVLRRRRLRRLFSFQAMYAGLAPAQALAIYSVITYLDCVEGVWFPAGGMHAVPRALAGAAAAHGVRFRYGTAAARIEVAGDRACAVHTGDGERIAADAIVVNADLPTAYAELLPPGYTPRRVKRLRYSPAAVVLHAGSSTATTDAHHTIDFGAAWDGTFTELIERGEPISDPSFLLTTPTLTDPSLAPAGRHIHYVLFPAPNLDPRRDGHVDWTTEGKRYRDHMVETLQARGYAGFGDGIECEHLITPADWRAGVWPPARRSPRRTGSRRPARSARRPSTGGSRTSCSPGRTANPAWACRWC